MVLISQLADLRFHWNIDQIFLHDGYDVTITVDIKRLSRIADTTSTAYRTEVSEDERSRTGTMLGQWPRKCVGDRLA